MDSEIPQWLPFAILGLVMSIGWAVIRLRQDRRRKERLGEGLPPRRERTSLERELQAEIDKARREAAVARGERVDDVGGNEGAPDELSLEPPAEAQAALRELERRHGEKP